MILHPLPNLSTRDFTYTDQTFVSEASTLGFKVGWPNFGRVYDDACDEGFTLISQRTGKECVMVIHEIVSDDDYSGGWKRIILRPAKPSERKLFRVVIYND